jgi:hypothetical protein
VPLLCKYKFIDFFLIVLEEAVEVWMLNALKVSFSQISVSANNTMALHQIVADLRGE